ncbi:MAG: TolC family protein, partial [Tannerellaceae bacterium]
KKEELGLTAGADIAQMEAKVAADSFNLVRQENYQHLSIIRLKELMNYPMDSALEIDTVLADFIPQTSINNLEEIKETALTTLPEAEQSKLLIKEAKLQHKMAQGSLFPYISLSGGISTNYYENLNDNTADKRSFSSQFKNNRGEYVTINLSFPLFNKLSNISRIKRSKYQYTISKLDHQATINKLEKDIEQAAADLAGTGKEYIQAQKQAYALQLAHRVNRHKYEEGLISVIELQTSSNQYLQAEADLVASRIRYLLKDKLVNYYRGIPLIP